MTAVNRVDSASGKSTVSGYRLADCLERDIRV